MKWCISPTSLTLSCVLLSWVCAPGVRSQVIPDGTLPVPTQVDPPNGPNFNIDGGTQAGGNLFHSFSEFSLSNGQAAIFNNAADVQNIFSRVTGGNLSNIDGLIQAQGTANLFLLNPAGIIFGANARLEIGGSFFGSTADSVVFQDGFTFSATNTNTPPLLTINVPVGLQFGPTPGDIQVRGEGVNRPFLDNPTVEDRIVRERTLLDAGNFGGLSVSPGRTLGLVGGNITFSGGLIQAPEGRIELGGVGAGSQVNIGTPETGFALNYEGVQNFQNIGLAERAGVFATGDKSGNIQVIGRNLTLTGGSEITTLTLGSQSGGSVTVNASGSISLIGESSSRKTTFLGAGTFAAGSLGNVTLSANESIGLRGSSQISAATQAAGRAGNITLNTGRLSIQDGSEVSAFTTLNSTGDAGNITVDADFIELSGNSPTGGISRLTAVTEGSGDAGKVTIHTQQLLVQDGGEVSAFTTINSPGNAGEIAINAEESVTISGISSGGINSSVVALTGGTGRAGNVAIKTQQFMAQDGGQVETLTFGETNRIFEKDGSILNRAGDITITALESVELSGKADFIGPITDEDILNSGLFASTEGTGDAGNITINTPKLTVRDEAVVVASTESTGNAGDINVNVNPPEGMELESIELTDDGGLLAETTGIESGSAGNVTLNTGEFIAEDGGFVATLTRGFTTQTKPDGTFTNSAGNIELTASESVKLRDEGSGFLAGTLGSGDAGNVTINTPRLSIRDRATIFVASEGQGNSELFTEIGDPGRIYINAETVRLKNEASLVALSETGQGGNINFDSTDIRIDESSVIFAYGNDSQEGDIDFISDILLLDRDNSAVLTLSNNRSGGSNISILPQNPEVLITSLSICDTCIIGASGTIVRYFYYSKLPLTNSIPIDVNSLIRDDVCEVGVGSEFIIPGSGGTPSSPLEPFSGSALTELDWIEFLPENIATVPQPENAASEEESPEPEYKPLVEAQGWIVGENGQIFLVADSPTVTPAVPALNRIDCTDE